MDLAGCLIKCVRKIQAGDFLVGDVVSKLKIFGRKQKLKVKGKKLLR